MNNYKKKPGFFTQGSLNKILDELGFKYHDPYKYYSELMYSEDQEFHYYYNGDKASMCLILYAEDYNKNEDSIIVTYEYSIYYKYKIGTKEYSLRTTSHNSQQDSGYYSGGIQGWSKEKGYHWPKFIPNDRTIMIENIKHFKAQMESLINLVDG